MLELRRRRREPKTLCPRCGMPLRDAGLRLQCPNCGYARLSARGRREVEERLSAALERLLAGTHGTAIAVTLRKLARAAGLGELEFRYAAYQWRKILPSLVEVNGSRWLRSLSDSDRKRAVYIRGTALRGAVRSGVGA